MGRITTVDFYDDVLFAVERDDGVYVAVKPICDTLGLRWRKQQERLRRDPILSKGITMVVMPSVGGMQETTCLRLELVNGWLFTIDESRVKDDLTREKVLRYKEECYRVLFQHFFDKAATRVLGDDEDAQRSVSSKLQEIREARQIFGSQAAAQLWFKHGMPMVPAMLAYDRQGNLFPQPPFRVIDGDVDGQPA